MLAASELVEEIQEGSQFGEILISLREKQRPPGFIVPSVQNISTRFVLVLETFEHNSTRPYLCVYIHCVM